MDFSENSDPDAVAELKENPNVEEGCVRQDCLSNPCPSGRQCYPLWEDFECRSVHCSCVGMGGGKTLNAALSIARVLGWG